MAVAEVRWTEAVVRRNTFLWAGGFVSDRLGDGVFELALTWAAIQSGHAAAVGVTLAAVSIPKLVILLLFGGTLVDRVNAKTMAIVAGVGRTIAAATATIGVGITHGSLSVLVAAAVVIGAFDGLFLPAVNALPKVFAREDNLGHVASIRTTVIRLALLVAAPLCGFVMAWSGVEAAFAVVAVLFAGAVALVSTIRTPRLARAQVPPIREVLRDTIDGFRIISAHRSILGLLLLAGLLNLGFAGPVTVAIPLLANANAWGSGGAGLLLGAFGSGALLFAVALYFRHPTETAGKASLVGAAGTAAMLALVGVVHGFVLVLVILILLGLINSLFSTVAPALMLTNAPEGLDGRVMGAMSLVLELSSTISLVLTGPAAAHWSPQPTFVVGGALVGVGVIVAILLRGTISLQLAESK